MRSKKLLIQISFFAFTGITNTFTDFFVFNLLLLLRPHAGTKVVLCFSVVGFLAANLQSYWLNKSLTFKGEKGYKWDRYITFLFISSFSLLINSSAFLVMQLLLPPDDSTLLLNIEKLSASMLGIVFNFIGYKKVVFQVTGNVSQIALTGICLHKWERTNSPSYTLVIPAYNESLRIERTLEELTHLSIRHPQLELIVVDDGSDDHTSECIRNFYLQLPNLIHYRLKKNWGKGGAVRFGLSVATGDYVFFCDADLSFPLEQLDDMIHDLQAGADVVVGVRPMAPLRPLKRWLLSRSFRALVRRLKLTTVQDTQCGFKGFRGHALAKLLPQTECCDFTFDIELLALAKLASMKIVEHQIRWSHQLGSTIRPKHILQMLFSLLFIRFRLARSISAEVIWCTALFVFAVSVRLPYLHLVPHFIDEWGEVRLASQISRGETWPLHNTAHDIGAFYNYLLAGVFAVWGLDLYIPRILVTIFSGMTVVLTFWLARQWTTLTSALIAALFMATNSMHILITHMAWSNDLTPFFVTISVLCALVSLKCDRPYIWALCGLMWALALQTHSSVLAPLLGFFVYMGKQFGVTRIHKDKRSFYFITTFLVGYSNMIIHNIVKPLDSLFWIQHKDYALNPGFSFQIYITNITNMAVELVRTLASAFPNGSGFLHSLSLLVMQFTIVGLLLSVSVIYKRQNGSLLLYLMISSFIIIPLFNHRYAYYISTRYIAFLLPICYVIMAVGLDAYVCHMKSYIQNWKLWRKIGTGAGVVALFFALPLYHFYTYSKNYVQLGQDNSAEYATVKQVMLIKRGHESVYVDLGGKQGKAIAEMLRVKGVTVHMLGEQPKVKMVSGVMSNRSSLDYSHWVPVLQNGSIPKGWFALSPEHVQPLTEHFGISWKKTLYITRMNGEAAYFLGRIEGLGHIRKINEKG